MEIQICHHRCSLYEFHCCRLEWTVQIEATVTRALLDKDRISLLTTLILCSHAHIKHYWHRRLEREVTFSRPFAAAAGRQSDGCEEHSPTARRGGGGKGGGGKMSVSPCGLRECTCTLYTDIHIMTAIHYACVPGWAMIICGNYTCNILKSH